MNKFQKNDEVKVIAGKDKGKTAKIIQVLPEKQKVRVEKINVAKRHTKPSKTGVGGIVEIEKPMDWSNVMIVCKYCKKPVKVAIAEVDGKKHRKCKACGELMDKK